MHHPLGKYFYNNTVVLSNKYMYLVVVQLCNNAFFNWTVIITEILYKLKKNKKQWYKFVQKQSVKIYYILLLYLQGKICGSIHHLVRGNFNCQRLVENIGKSNHFLGECLFCIFKDIQSYMSTNLC